jgi:hypothetical protein
LNKNNIDPNIKPYLLVRGELTIRDGLLLLGDRIVVPKEMQAETLDEIHEGHKGYEKCCLRAKNSVGGQASLDNSLNTYNTATHVLATNPRAEPMIPTTLPDYPWQKVGTDLFHFRGATYITVFDYFSRYLEIMKLTSTTWGQSLRFLKRSLLDMGSLKLCLVIMDPSTPPRNLHYSQKSTTLLMSRAVLISHRATDKQNGQSRS